MTKPYVLNSRSRTVHKVPTTERCNVDQIPKTERRYSADVPAGAKRCGWCFPTA